MQSASGGSKERAGGSLGSKDDWEDWHSVGNTHAVESRWCLEKAGYRTYEDRRAESRITVALSNGWKLKKKKGGLDSKALSRNKLSVRNAPLGKLFSRDSRGTGVICLPSLKPALLMAGLVTFSNTSVRLWTQERLFISLLNRKFWNGSRHW